MEKQCSHGVKWDDHCNQCEMVSLRETIAKFEPIVERAKKRLAALTGDFFNNPEGNKSASYTNIGIGA